GGYDNGLGMNIAEIDGTFVLPFPYSQNAPLLITPGFAVDWTQGPITSTTGADLPPQMYEAYIDAAWRPKFGPRFGADLGFRTGVYSDFSYFNNFSMRYIGRGYGTYTWSPHLELKAGVVYIDRLRMKLLPAGGLIWNPDPDTRFEILFPNPKLAIRMTTFGNVDVWGYVAGEYGGGSWTITRDSTNPFLPPSHDEVEYDDIKIISGIEWTGKLNLKGFVEGGFVWNRKLNYRSDIGNLDLRNTIMVRGGIAF
ncbi:MAG: hypothetical protein K8T25_17315, partial [Planctomycetia bacterium]|nr:hypothetical protein [Planctomycetia bacterium]